MKTIPSSWDKQVDIETSSVTELLQNREFYIPHFQREFVWDVKLIRDVFNTFKEDFIFGKKLFLGNFIISEVNNKCEVIDGQQRLSFIILLLIILYEKSGELEVKLETYMKNEPNNGLWPDSIRKVREHKEVIWKNLFVDNGENFPELRLKYDKSRDEKNHNYQSLLKKILQKESTKINLIEVDSKTKNSIRVLKNLVTDLISHVDETRKVEVFTKFLDFVLDKTDLSIVRIVNDASGPEIFQRINSNSTALTDWELVNNYVSKEIHLNNSKTESQKFIKEINGLVRKNKNKLLNHQVVVNAWDIFLTDYASSKTNKFLELKDYYDNKSMLSDKIKTRRIQEDLTLILNTYIKLEESRFENDEINYIYHMIDRYGLEQLRKYYIALIAKHGDNDDLNKAFKLLMAMVFNVIIFQKMVANKVESPMKTFFVGSNPSNYVENIKKSNLYSLWNPDAFLLETFNTINSKKITFCIFLTFIYEANLMHEFFVNEYSEDRVRFADLREEKLMPSAITVEWLNYVNSGKIKYELDDLKSIYAKLPGNKILMSQDGITKGKDTKKYIDQKISLHYKNSKLWNLYKDKFLSQKDIIVPELNTLEWSPIDIEKRSKKLFEYFKEKMIEIYESNIEIKK